MSTPDVIARPEPFPSRGPEAWRLVMFGALLIGVMIFAPKGLAGLKKYLW